MSIPHVKYMGTIYAYITGSGYCVNPSWAQPLYSYLVLTTSSVEVINMHIFRRSV